LKIPLLNHGLNCPNLNQGCSVSAFHVFVK
jgi:hypothetical protein